MTEPKTTSDDASVQDSVFALLSDPAEHPQARRIDTHAASVFLEGARALKIKRAVRFPFLDYSTLEKRKAACEEELRINRPFAPQIYRRVIPIVRSENGSLSLGGNGTPVEYAIEMTRFDENQTIDHLAQAGPLDPGLVDGIADAIATSHGIVAPADHRLWVNSISGLIADNSSALRAAGQFAATEIDDLDNASQTALARTRHLLETRGRSGFVRRCHADLHLANIVLIGQKPVLFDAIEFDEKMATVDVLYDLAFPLMDLLRYERPEAANRLLNRYLAITPADNADALATLPLLMSIRAAIRAKVLLARMRQAHSEPDHASTTAVARRYFELACTLIHPPAPALVAVGGLSGTGKSVLARAIAPLVAPLPGAIIVRSDILRKQLFGVAETAPLPSDAYQMDVTERIYRMLIDRAVRSLSQGHSVVLDAVYATAAERDAVCEAARRLGVSFVGFFLVADLATRQSRIARRAADASDATPEIAAVQDTYEIGAVDWTIIDASGTPEMVLERCRTALARLRPAR